MGKVECKVEGSVRHVLLKRADKRNALDGEMVEQIAEAFSAPPVPRTGGRNSRRWIGVLRWPGPPRPGPSP